MKMIGSYSSKFLFFWKNVICNTPLSSEVGAFSNEKNKSGISIDFVQNESNLSPNFFKSR